jgi:excinuclease UvrABC helicase subunit UvrB
MKSMEEVKLSTHVADARTERPTKEKRSLFEDLRDPTRRAGAIQALERQMREAAAELEFELAATLRDQINELKAIDAGNVNRGGSSGGGSGRRGRRVRA